MYNKGRQKSQHTSSGQKYKVPKLGNINFTIEIHHYLLDLSKLCNFEADTGL